MKPKQALGEKSNLNVIKYMYQSLFATWAQKSTTVQISARNNQKTIKHKQIKNSKEKKLKLRASPRTLSS